MSDFFFTDFFFKREFLDCSHTVGNYRNCTVILLFVYSDHMELQATASRSTNLSTCWCFTWNNPTLTPEQFQSAIADSWNAQYCIFQPEQGMETHTPHFQGYVEWPSKQRKRLTAVRKLLPTAHWEPRIGTREQARAYCMPQDLAGKAKDGVVGQYVEVGVWNVVAQGKRNDLDAAVDTLRESGWSAMVDQHPTTFVKFSRGLGALALELGEERTDPPTVYILYGPTGCGKSRTAFGYATRAERWVAPIGCSGGWFDGYHGQPLAVLDDFAGKLTGYRLDDVLRLLDRYEVTAPVKGGFTLWRPDVIAITTNIHPSNWWDYTERREQYAALQRRVTMVVSWGRDGRRRIMGLGHPQWQQWWRGPLHHAPPALGPMDDWVEHPEQPDQYSFIFE